MSWSANYIGNPLNIVEALKKQSESISGKSKEELDAALPHIADLLKQNYNKNAEPVLRLSASGHGHDGYNTCSVNIENLGGLLV